MRSKDSVVHAPVQTDDASSCGTLFLEKTSAEGNMLHPVGRKSEEETKKRKEAQSWTAHKADDGSVRQSPIESYFLECQNCMQSLSSCFKH